MAVEKISISLEKSLAKRIKQLARKEKLTVSALAARALEHEARLEALGKAIAHYEAEFGEISEEDARRAGKILWPD